MLLLLHFPVPPHISLTSVDQSHPSAADRDSDLPPYSLLKSSSVMHFGTRAFDVSCPKAWNQLPMHNAHTSTGDS